MKKVILFTTAVSVLFWANALDAQATNTNQSTNQVKMQKRDGTGPNHDWNAAAGQGSQQGKRKGNSQKAAKGKQAKNGPGNGSGNMGNRPQDGTGHGAKSGNRTGPMDGTGQRQGGWNIGSQRGSSGGMGGRGSSPMGSSRGGRGGRGGGRR